MSKVELTSAARAVDSSLSTPLPVAPGFLFRMFERMGSYFLLTKPRIVLLVLMTGFTAMLFEGSLLADPLRLAGVLLGILMAAGAANALNQYWDRDIDAVMSRTRDKRPIPTGKISPRGALWFGLISGIAAIWLLKTAGNTFAALLGIGTIAYYVLLYTMWLKRRTSLNIVIGGASGAAAPLIGWAAGAGELSLVPLLMFLVIFLWTPPQFWALALFRKDEYAKAGIPMLPVVAGEKNTTIQIVFYTILLLAATAYLGFHADLGLVFFAGATFLGSILLLKAIRLLRMKDRQTSRELYSYSIVYLTVLFTIMALLLNGCSTQGPHSILDPAGPHAEHIAALWWQMLIIYGIVFVVTLAIVALALIARRSEKPVLGPGFVFIAGIAIPTLILVIMVIVTIRVTVKLAEGPADFRVQVVGHHWWFEVRYPDHGIVDANEIHVPVGTMVRYELSSGGVVHSFWVPRLGGKRDLLPDHPTELLLKADLPGVYHGTCTEYCGGPHALMDFRLVAHEPEEFEQWLQRNKQPRPAPSEPRLLHGREVFMNAGCAACHSINGLSQADTGPDLTTIGSRLTLGAGILPNTPGNLYGWIANPQSLKPRNMMPRSYLPPEDLHNLVEYLWSLK
jgi:protoheme IX farnesyltransferase